MKCNSRKGYVIPGMRHGAFMFVMLQRAHTWATGPTSEFHFSRLSLI
jgi:hypothetical protein